ncbi:hypothetical protein H6P81_001150 [Aristolochia fimbriata]|uniref:Uncharacterized protein n=1 Tax=Aristolochia fimbriata TaxID=158543 RepID=A0AAV7F9D4_ARIFI|nr:hypothetical protein H6P81_001150 [Aristolochia fimbriata]
MEEYLRKLALWHTKTFRPIITHEELEPIMATLGFVALPATTVGGTPWKEYVFSAAGCQKPNSTGATDPPPRPRLPFPRIDALHIYTYRAFFDAVAHFLGKRDIADHFHVRNAIELVVSVSSWEFGNVRKREAAENPTGIVRKLSNSPRKSPLTSIRTGPTSF